MDMQGLLNSPQARASILWLCQRIPPGPGYRLSKLIAARIAASRETQVVQAVRANQWVVHGEALGLRELDQAVLECWQSITRSFYELFHSFESAARMQSLVKYSPEVEALIARSQEPCRPGRPGLILAGVHLAGFDIVSQAASLHGLKAIALSLPQATQAIEWQHKFRRQAGMEIMPPSLVNLRHTLQRLAAGEFVLTGIDRPMPGLKYRPYFFGKPALLPTHHITLALKAHAPVVVLAPVREPDGRYTLYLSGELEMQSYSDHKQEIVGNAEQVLEAAADLICKARRQWAITHPVWQSVAPH